MTLPLIITICVLILIAYAFDITAKRTKVPTVIFLLLLGWAVKSISVSLNLNFVRLDPLLPIFGTLGLILIVLEGGLELEINKNKIKLIKRAIWTAFLPLIVLFLCIGMLFYFITDTSVINALVNAAPFCIISSAIAIPSVQNLSKENKELVVYESSMSDILGVLLFDFLIANEVIRLTSFLHFGLQLVIILAISLAASIGLAFLIKKITHHVKLIPIMMMIVLIYAIAKVYHLPALLFILIFGLFLNNLDEFKRLSFIRYLQPQLLNLEVHRFSRLVAEAAFLIRSIFFILFGYTITIDNLTDLNTLPYALGILVLIVSVRFVQMKLTKQSIFPMLFIAPRGLITIMVFLSIPFEKKIEIVNQSLVLQVIIMTILLMMIGLIFHQAPGKDVKDEEDEVMFPNG